MGFSESSGRGQGRVCVLIVDDDRAVLDVAADALKDTDYQLLLASDGETALRLIESHQPRVLVLDLNIPHISGPFVATMAQMAVRPPRLIVCSGVADAEQIARDVGADAVLRKPFARADLRALIDRHAAH